MRMMFAWPRAYTSAVLLAFLLPVLGGCGDKVQPLPTLSNTAPVLAFGDSLTFGTGADSAKSYPAQLSALIKREVINRGVPGELSRDGLARLPTVLDEVQPSLLILCHGGNDFLRKTGDDAAAANVRAMVALARQRNIPVVLLATPKPGLSLATPDFYAAIAKENSIPIDTKTLADVLSSRSLKADLVHPNAEGYAVIAKALDKLLRKAGAI